MHSVLEKIIGDRRTGVDRSSEHRSALEMAISTMPAPADGLAALGAPGLRIIAEVKRRSPSEGALREGVVPAALASSYEAAGAAAISVLTEEMHFGGTLADLKSVAESVALPCLRKDFIVSEVQILEARAAGAALILLIVAALSDDELRRFMAFSEALGLQALVEVHTEEETRRALGANARIIGVNNRNLHTLSIDLQTAEQLRPIIGTQAVAVAESGIRDAGDIQRLHAVGYNAFLVGSSLMKAPDPSLMLRELLQQT